MIANAKTRDAVVIRFLTVIAAGAMIAGLGAAFAQTAGGSLPPGPGYDTLVRVCSDCHGADVVMGKSLDRAGWTEIVSMMADRGASVTPADATVIVDYLTANLGPPGAAAASPAAPPAAQ
jgi:hypothetical protein